jgi:hypothetical protein
VTHCGSCTQNCTVVAVNANSVSCTAGTCSYASCKTGYAECDGNLQDGCECACGAGQGAKGQPCCPGKACLAGNTCNGANKCI